MLQSYSVARFVFVHGAWHGAWCWQRLRDELERRGHETHAVDLPCETVGLTARDYADAVGPQPGSVVVGHSLGGLTASLVPAAVTVFLAALVPVDNVAVPTFDTSFTGTLRDEHGRSYWPDERTARERLYPDLEDDDASWAFSLLRRQAPLEEIKELPAGRCASIVTLRDRAITPEYQLEAARSVLGVDPLELDAGHSPFISHPVELAGLLEWIASE
jgi:pimeloyl-ACP methyl ester carboxylesterase